MSDEAHLGDIAAVPDVASLPVRRSARLIILDPAGQLLLYRIDSQSDLDRVRLGRSDYWITFGGGLEAGETPEAAARRELREETGWDVPVGPELWNYRQVFPFNGTWIRAEEHYFIVHAPAREVSFGRMDAEERAVALDTHWWTVEEMLSTGEVMMPFGFRRLADLIASLSTTEHPAGVRDLTAIEAYRHQPSPNES